MKSANATNTNITAFKAYSSIYDTVSNEVKTAAKFPNKNFTDVISTKLAKSGSVDISNLVTNKKPGKYVESIHCM